MASSYFMLKFLRQKPVAGIRLSKNKLYIKEKQIDTKTIEIKTKPINDFSQKCRICLKEGDIPIYGDQYSNLSEDVRTFGGIELDEKDDYPKNLCLDCFTLLQSAIAFRKTAHKSEKYLKEAYFMTHPKPECHNSKPHDEFDSNKNDIDDKADQDFVMDTGFSESETEAVQLPTEVPDKKTEIKKNSKRLDNIDGDDVLLPKMVEEKVRVQCSICNALLTPELYKSHLRRHDLASRLICEVCGRMCRRDNIDVHTLSHTTNLPFQCKLCPYRGRVLYSLQCHMKVHTGQKPFSCDKCPKQFTCRSNLNKHLLVHAKIRPHACSHCGKRFFTNSNLEDHINSYHLGIKYTCETCGNDFATRKSLRKHELRIHKREKFLLGRPLYMKPEYNK